LMRDFKGTARFLFPATTESPSGLSASELTIASVLEFWDERLPGFNVEELFGFLDSHTLPEVTGEAHAAELRKGAVVMIERTILTSVKNVDSDVHMEFVKRIEDRTPVITFNWDTLVEDAVIANNGRVSYALRDTPDWNPRNSSDPARKVLKMHGSLNWVFCDGCQVVTYLRDDDTIDLFLAIGKGVTCRNCRSGNGLRLLLVPPVLSKLGEGSGVLSALWREAYITLTEAARIFLVGYSFPATDIQTRLFFCKALREAAELQELVVITKPKFGTARVQFEDHYRSILAGSEQEDKVRFRYSTFGQLDWENI